jgi:hypothetical protein
MQDWCRLLLRCDLHRGVHCKHDDCNSTVNKSVASEFKRIFVWGNFFYEPNVEAVLCQSLCT